MNYAKVKVEARQQDLTHERDLVPSFELENPQNARNLKYISETNVNLQNLPYSYGFTGNDNSLRKITRDPYGIVYAGMGRYFGYD